ncbi:MAG TPA: response regulator [Flavisolibacter sp.]|nr:response regulator [Flavisolibacter sp.]
MNNTQHTRKILLVEDDADDRKYFGEAVAEIDDSIECVMARDGKQAIDLLRDHEASLPDYIFLDLRMPKINGRQCLLQIKADERLKNIPVIVYTTSREVQESEELQSLGAVRFITKPANTEEIYYVISQVLEEQGNNPR